nr:MAG TPA: hypothetical protein [Caudoviricetes sp.]
MLHCSIFSKISILISSYNISSKICYLSNSAPTS